MCTRTFLLFGLALTGSFIGPGCETPSSSGKSTATSSSKDIVFFSITTDGSTDPQRLDMALKLAGFALDEKKTVFVFFNVKGVHVPAKTFPEDRKFQENATLKEQLQTLIDRGAVVHVCPICMKGLGVDKSQIIDGVQVTTRKELFARITGNTTVFTY